jgi:hypothetical protein
MVAAATNNLCEAANAAVQGHASQEKLISSAKQVAASTAQLLVACKVKADQDSEAMKRLQVRNRPILFLELYFKPSPPTCISVRELNDSQLAPYLNSQLLMLSVGIGCWQCSKTSLG